MVGKPFVSAGPDRPCPVVPMSRHSFPPIERKLIAANWCYWGFVVCVSGFVVSTPARSVLHTSARELDNVFCNLHVSGADIEVGRLPHVDQVHNRASVLRCSQQISTSSTDLSLR